MAGIGGTGARTPMRQTFGCCARAASGHAAAAPPSAASNSRRPMVPVMRPSRARCVNATIPCHERTVFTPSEPTSPLRSRPALFQEPARGPLASAWPTRQSCVDRPARVDPTLAVSPPFVVTATPAPGVDSRLRIGDDVGNVVGRDLGALPCLLRLLYPTSRLPSLQAVEAFDEFPLVLPDL